MELIKSKPVEFEESHLNISLRHIAIQMLLIAYVPYLRKLSFGSNDMICKYLEQFIHEFNNKSNSKFKNVWSSQINIDKCIEKTKDIFEKYFKHIRAYVPTRLLAPFFDNKLNKMPDHLKDKKIREFASKDNIFYKIEEDKIIFNKSWYLYLRKNFRIVHDWTAWNWLKYMESKNEKVPNISNKLFYNTRRSLKLQKEYWKLIISRSNNVKCIYSDKEINQEKFSLDHYIPWKFLNHDELWNIIPIFDSSINSSKYDHFPSEEYLEKFIDIQYNGLKIFYKNFSKNEKVMKKYSDIIEYSLLVLELSKKDLDDNKRNLFITKYKKYITNEFKKAESLGFGFQKWKYSSK